ncbi:MAG TPA: hypothetical protein VGE47_12770 [Burkholderiaceae bacterium]
MQILNRALAALLLGASLSAHADGLADLKSALQRLTGQQALRATISVKSQNRQGEGKEARTDIGAASLMVDDDAQGLRLSYAADTLAQVRAEEQAREEDKKAKTPTKRGLSDLGLSQVRAMTHAGESLRQEIAGAAFKGESADTWNGRPARLLSFDLGARQRSAEEEEYIKKSEGSLQVWIAADGTPLESRMQMKAAGRALLLISFEISAASKVLFERLGDRLIATRREMQQGGSGAGKKGEGRTEYSLQLRP